MQGKVAQFNNLSKENTQKRNQNEAALKRAVVGREEAESELRRLKQMNAELKSQITDYEHRERKVGLRLEAKMVRTPHDMVQALTIHTGGARKARGGQGKSDGEQS